MATEYRVIGQPVPLVDAYEKVKGIATYSVDEHLAGMLYGKVLASPHAHANIKSIDTSKTEALPGVKAVLTYKDVTPVRIGTGGSPAGHTMILENRVRCVGEEVAAVAADTEEIAEEALKLIEVNYEVLPAVFDAEEALKPGAPILYPYPEYPGGNLINNRVYTQEKGDVNAGLQAADTIYEDVISVPYTQIVNALGRLCAIDYWESDGRLIEIDSTQSSGTNQRGEAKWLGLPLSKIRVIHKYMGIGYGRGNVFRYTGIAALLSKKAQRPVRLLMPPEYSFICHKKRQRVKAYLKAGVKKDGTLTAYTCNVFVNKGNADGGGPSSSSFTIASRANYGVPNWRQDVSGALTNYPPNGSYRGWGEPEAKFIEETFMDRIANKLGMDPLEFRKKNLNLAGGRVTTAIDLCAERFRWKDRWSPPSTKTGVKRRGVGMAINVGWTSGYGTGTFCSTLQLLEDGSAILVTSTNDCGQGIKTALVQVVAEELGMKVENVQIIAGDTAGPEGPWASASRSAVVGGNMAYVTCQDFKSKLFNVLAPKLGVKPEDLEMKGEKVSVKSDPTKFMTLKEAGTTLKSEVGYIVGVGVNADPAKNPSKDPNSHSCQMAEVEVDTETGSVEVLDLFAVYNIGKSLNPAIVEGQMIGCMGVGIGFGITEDNVFDPTTGYGLNDTYLGSGVPTFLDIPELKPFAWEGEPNPHAFYGQRGVGESVVGPTAPAINNAIYNAIGVNLDSVPFTPAKILKALGKA